MRLYYLALVSVALLCSCNKSEEKKSELPSSQLAENLNQKDKEIAKLKLELEKEKQAKEQKLATMKSELEDTKNLLSEREKELSKKKESSNKTRSFLLERARARVRLDKEWQKLRLAELESMIDKIIDDPEQAARLENNLFRNIQRLSEFYDEALKYRATDEHVFIKDPIMALKVMKNALQGIVKISKGDEKMFFEALQHQFGDEEAVLVMQLDLSPFSFVKE